MHTQTSCDLPECARGALPQHAQVLYRKAFTCAWEQYAGAVSCGALETRETIARQIAWNAVKNIYEKDEKSGVWSLRRETQRL